MSARLYEARLYVYDLQLIDGEGKRTPLILGRNDWQFANLALLDFKDARGGNTPCGKATPAKNVVVTGSAPPGAYEGLEFSVGVPIEAEVDGAKMSLNHSNVEQLPTTRYRRDELELASRPQIFELRHRACGRNYQARWLKARTWFVHLGSTGCTGNPATGEIVACLRPNRFTVTLGHIDLATQRVQLDLATLFKSTDLSIDQGGAIGCMSGFDDPDCSGIFEQRGLNLVETSPGAGDAGKQRRRGLSPIFPPAPYPTRSRAPGSNLERESGSRLSLLLIGATSKVIGGQPTLEKWRWDLPSYVPLPRVPADNPMSEAKFQLGRHSFYDKRLSGNETLSCASCHKQERAFSDGRATSIGSTGEDTPRHAASLANVAWRATLSLG